MTPNSYPALSAPAIEFTSPRGQTDLLAALADAAGEGFDDITEQGRYSVLS